MWWSFLSALFDSSFVSVVFIMAFVGTKKIPERLWLKLIATDATWLDRNYLPWFWLLFSFSAQLFIHDFFMLFTAHAGTKLDLWEYNMSGAYNAIALNWWRLCLFTSDSRAYS